MKKKMKTIVITRKYWGRGQLRNSEGMRCCLGFVSEALGVPQTHTLGIGYPCSLDKSLYKRALPAWLKSSGLGSDVMEAANINDANHIGYEEKEKKLKELFAKHNIRLVFRGQR